MSLRSRPENEFSGALAFCSNFFPRSIVYQGVRYKTREHAFQAQKFTDPELRALIRRQPTPPAAKWKAHELKEHVRSDWREVNLQIMDDIVLVFFQQWPDMRELLVATQDRHLEEKNYWHDTFWGTCNGVGENHLGKSLMRARDLVGPKNN